MLSAQTEVGIRFASYLNYFSDPQLSQLVESQFSTGILGINVYQYFEKSRLEYGLNIIHKGTGNGAFPNLPLIMQDFGDDEDVGLTAVEAHGKAGPSFDLFFPYIGYSVGYRLRTDNFFRNNSGEVNRVYLSLPIGFAFNFPTNFGSVGFGGAFYLGLTNVVSETNLNSGRGRMNSIGFELTVAYGSKPRFIEKKKKR